MHRATVAYFFIKPMYRIVKKASGVVVIIDIATSKEIRTFQPSDVLQYAESNAVINLLDSNNATTIAHRFVVVASTRSDTKFITETQVEPLAAIAAPVVLQDLFVLLQSSFFNETKSGTSGGGGGDATAANQVLEIAELQSIKTNQTNRTQKTQISDGVEEATIKVITAGLGGSAMYFDVKINVPSDNTTTLTLTNGGATTIQGNVDWIPTGLVATDIIAIQSAMNSKFTGWTATTYPSGVILTKNTVGAFPAATLVGNNSPSGIFNIVTTQGTNAVAAQKGLDMNLAGDDIGVAKETKQDAQTAELVAIKNAILAQSNLALLVYEDAAGVFVIRRETDAGAISFEDITGAPIVPTPPLVPVGHTKSVIQKYYDATATGVGYLAGDILCRLAIFDANLPSFVPVFIWLNFTQGTTIASPTSGTYEAIEENIGARQVGVWNVNTGLTQPLTDTQLRAAPVPISDGTDNTGVTQLNTGTGSRGWLSGIYKRITDAFTASTAWFFKLSDGTNNATIKAASTAPAAADTAIVVVESPNNTTFQTSAGGTTAAKTVSVGAAFNTTFPALTNGQGSALQTDSSGRLIVSLGASSYVLSTGNSSTTNLGAGASFTGTILDVLSAPALVLSVRTTQATTITVTQYDDLAGTIAVETSTFTRAANTPLNTPIKLSGNYARVSVTNNGAIATTSMLIDTYIGVLETLPTTLTNRGQLRVSIDEVAQTTNGHTSGTITLGGTAQTLLAANTSRKYFEFQNRSVTDMILCIGSTATATNGIILAGGVGGVGGSYTMPANVVMTGAISIFCATTGRAFTYLEA